ncbi:MAG: NAD(P) transhydrogenase subunit alpha [Alphaproteobacteria bacterium]|nr:NAD(P) transhydrogenase subunit alpha [Alphaproteobacteria bacterium]NCQ67180.1 NAD(P) transhydrogenase subunit alpha [Alphaproteobacteria bacterium]NCT07025.1 NAD(P) transhydrogenase subunit alpha [Alphaproteobacteria bacterium]
MSLDTVVQNAKEISSKAVALAEKSTELQKIAQEAINNAAAQEAALGTSPLIMGLTIFILAVFVGYYVVWKVTPALHSPLMAITNAVSSVIIVGALMAAGLADFNFASIMGFIAVTLASINIFGGFIVTQRMLSMFSSNKKKK